MSKSLNSMTKTELQKLVKDQQNCLKMAHDHIQYLNQKYRVLRSSDRVCDEINFYTSVPPAKEEKAEGDE